MLDETAATERHEKRVGVAYGVSAYLWWGLCPIYFKAIAHVWAIEVLAHRVAWSVLFLHAFLVIQRRWQTAMRHVWHRGTVLRLIGSTILIACNWLTFIWAVTSGRVSEASLGYFMNPLVSVLLAFAILGERLRRLQWASVVLAAIGVGWWTVHCESWPWISMVLAFTFGLYGLLRKTIRVDSLTALTAETTLLTPMAIAFLAWTIATGQGAFLHVSTSTTLLLSIAGVITAVPLIWFGHAAKRLRLSTVGFLQYIAPTGQLLLAVFLFGEPFTRQNAVSFAFIWCALLIYSLDGYVAFRSSSGATLRART